jgi:hypothetical protein
MEVLNICGEQLLAISPPEEKDAPVRLNGRFYDDGGQETIVIRDNEIIVSSGTWDIETIGGRMIIRSAPRDIALELTAIPRQSIHVARLKMSFRDVRVAIEEGLVCIGRAGTAQWTKKFKGEIWSARCCIAVFDEASAPASGKEARCDQPTPEDYEREKAAFATGSVRPGDGAAMGVIRNGLFIMLGVGCSYSQFSATK